MKRLALTAAAALAALAAAAAVDAPGSEQAKTQARSVHLRWKGIPPNAAEVAGSVTVRQEQTNTFYMAIGFDCGYMGVQNLNGRHVGIMSVWDASGSARDWHARPGDVADEERVKLVFGGEGVAVSRFGGEGTGVKALFELPWRVGEPVRFRVTAESDGKGGTVFAGYVSAGGGEERKIAAVARPRHAVSALRGIHSFVEDFWRNGLSRTLVRRADFTGFSYKTPGAEAFAPATGALFSADENTLMTIDAGPVEGGAFLQTGGDTANEHAPLWSAFPVH